MSPHTDRFLFPLLPTALLTGSLLACSDAPREPELPAGPTRPGTTRQSLIPLPPDSQFIPFSCRSAPANDVLGDPVGGGERDVVGSNLHPAFFRSASATHIFFRLRLNESPLKQGGSSALTPSSYDVLLDTDGDYRTYEYMLTADGNMGGTRVQFVRNSVQSATDPTDPAMDSPGDLLHDLQPTADYYTVTQASDGSLFGGTPDYFITLAVPRSVLTGVGINLGNRLVVWGGTNSQNYSLNADFGCYAGMPPNLADAATDPAVLDPLNTPQAEPDSDTTLEDTAKDTAVLANDLGLANTPLTVTVVTPPAHGTAVVNADNTVRYTPGANYNGPDSYTYRVRDSDGETSTATVTMTVQPVSKGAPRAVADVASTNEDTAVVMEVLANDTGLLDPPFTVSIVAAPLYGTATVGADHRVTYTPAAHYNGMDSYTYEVRDSDGQTSSAMVSVTVLPVNDGAPMAQPDTVTIDEDTARATNVLANDTGLEDAPVTVTLVTPPLHGTATVNADNTITYTPEAHYNGPDSYTYRVRDSDGETSTATVSLTVLPVDNGTPVAQADTFLVDEDTALTSDVLANDSGLTDGPLTVTLVTPPQHGTLTLNANNTVTYTPTNNFHGPDSYTYRVTDADAQSATGTVSITVRPVNDAPHAENDVATAFSDGTGATVAVLANDSDVDGDALGVTAVTQGAHGTVTLNGDGTLTYVATRDSFGTDTFTYTVDDGNGGTVVGRVTMTVKVANDTDGDGLSDAAEEANGLDPNDPDTDDDGVTDGSEPAWRADSDADGLINALDPDSDNDGLFDGTELGVTVAGPGTNTSRGTFKPDADPSTTTDPLQRDTDKGGLRDGYEDPHHDGRVDPGDRDPLVAADDESPNPDTDGDGLSDDEETAHGLDPNDADSDDDGVADGSEPNWVVDGDGDGLINALDADSDGDGLFDGTELGVTTAGPGTDVAGGHFVPDTDPSTTTSPLLPDTDGGGVVDGDEDTNHDGRKDPDERDPLVRGDDHTMPDLCAANNGERPDLDGDGLADACDPDADGNGLIDDAGAAGGGCAAAGGGLSPLVLLALGALARRRRVPRAR